MSNMKVGQSMVTPVERELEQRIDSFIRELKGKKCPNSSCEKLASEEIRFQTPPKGIKKNKQKLKTSRAHERIETA